MPKKPPIYPDSDHFSKSEIPAVQDLPQIRSDSALDVRDAVSIAIEDPLQYDQMTIAAFNECLLSVADLVKNSSPFLRDQFRTELSRLQTEIGRLELLRNAGTRLDEVLFALRGRTDSFSPHDPLTEDVSHSYLAASRLAALAQELKEAFASIGDQRQSSTLNHEEAAALNNVTHEAYQLFGSLFDQVPATRQPSRSSSAPGDLTVEARRERAHNAQYAHFLAKIETLNAMQESSVDLQGYLEDAIRAYLAFVQFKMKDSTRRTSMILHAYGEKADNFLEVLKELQAGNLKPKDAYRILRKSRSLIERGQITAELASLIADVCQQSLRLVAKQFPEGTFKELGVFSDREREYPELPSTSEQDPD